MTIEYFNSGHRVGLEHQISEEKDCHIVVGLETRTTCFGIVNLHLIHILYPERNHLRSLKVICVQFQSLKVTRPIIPAFFIIQRVIFVNSIMKKELPKAWRRTQAAHAGQSLWSFCGNRYWIAFQLQHGTPKYFSQKLLKLIFFNQLPVIRI